MTSSSVNQYHDSALISALLKKRISLISAYKIVMKQ